MLQTLRNRRNRKGFTLAELLIVVAIIAVLVAIAVPLFVGALNNAEERVAEANCRAVRAAAVNEILLETTGKYKTPVTTGTLQGPWTATATVDGTGNITTLKIETKDTAAAPDGYRAAITGSTNAYYQKTGTNYSIIVVVKVLTVTE